VGRWNHFRYTFNFEEDFYDNPLDYEREMTAKLIAAWKSY